MDQGDLQPDDQRKEYNKKGNKRRKLFDLSNYF